DLRLVAQHFHLRVFGPVFLVLLENGGLADYRSGTRFEQDGIVREQVGKSLGIVGESRGDVLLVEFFDRAPRRLISRDALPRISSREKQSACRNRQTHTHAANAWHFLLR